MAERNRGFAAGSRVRLGLASDEWLIACVRRGDTAAFEALYDRHVRELLGFCVYMLRSRQDAEDAVQATFASAYRALQADSRPVALRPWLFTIARNDCLSILRRRRPMVELNGQVAPDADPVDQIALREEVRRVFEGLHGLPENQRAALVLAEVHGLSHQEVGQVLGVRADQVKAFVYQARSKLVSERAARDVDCREIREELATARGAALLRGRLRRHMRSCPDCRVYADGVARQRRQLGALLPVVPSLALKYRAIEQALGVGAADPVAVAGGATVAGTAAGTAAELAGGGFNALVCKVAVGVACLGASAGVGVSVLDTPPAASQPGSASGATGSTAALLASVSPADTLAWTNTAPAFAQEGSTTGGRGGANQTLAGGEGGALPEVQNGVALREGSSPLGGAGGRTHGGPVGGRERRARSNGDSGAGGESSGASERRSVAEHRQLRREGHRQLTEERRKAHEEPRPVGGFRPPKSEEELLRKKEENTRRREEHKPEGHSRAPRTEEEIRLKREKNERIRAEKRKLREEAEARAREAEDEAAAPPAP
ncbi:MAG: polymerase, sigma-24 subunit, subfamily [Solirubrobacterales bacterium]|nr:polymerase, sigma-24 subunit, subfamily [Solirubrobacterales bacterium]